MAGRFWTDEEAAFAKERFERGDDVKKIRGELADKGWGRSLVAINKKAQNDGWHRTIMPAPFEIYNKAPKLEGDVLILSDIHAPFHDAAWCNKVITYALRTGIKQVVLNGDMIDWAAFGIYGRLAEVEAESEIAATKQFFEGLAEFEQVIEIMGNHEMRLIRLLNYKLGAERLAPLYSSHPSLIVSDYHWCTIRSGGEKWRISHPRNAHMVPCSVARRLVVKHNCHVAAGHDHVCGMVLTEDSRHWAISTGTCVMPKKLDYVTLIDNTRWKVAQGALIIRDGYPELLTPDNPRLQ
jgi:phage tail protein X